MQAPLDATLRRLDVLVGQVHAALPPHTLLVLHTGQVRWMHVPISSTLASVVGIVPRAEQLAQRVADMHD